MTPRDWLTSRQHTPAARGKHRATPPDIKETSLSPSLAASLPGPMPRPAHWNGPIFARNWDTEPEPDKVVNCGFCHVSGLSSQIPETAGGEHRCSEAVIDECVQRSIRYNANGGQQPRPLVTFPATGPEPLPKREAGASLVAEPLPQPEEEPLPELPPVQEAALAAFNRDHDAQDEAEKAAGTPETAEPAEPVSDEQDPAEDSAPAPVTEDHAPRQSDPAED